MPEAEKDDRLGRAIASYLGRAEAGLPADRRAFLERYPDLAPDLESFFDSQDHLSRWDRAMGVPGKEFAGYQVLEEISRGGMGVVYRARQISLGRVVALKVVLLTRRGSSEALERFRREAVAAARLEHSHVVPVYDVGEWEGCPYFTMKYLEGGSLAESIQRFSKDHRAAAALLVDVARAVHHAHVQGILHRDLKPANILLDTEGKPYVADFGLAKLREGGETMTRSGEVLGTPSYMPPEQASGKRVAATPASDVYSLGAILYEILTGRPPFRGESSTETLRRVIEDEPVSPSRFEPRMSRDLETICLRCLEKDPLKRLGGADVLAEELGRYLRGEPIRSRPVSSLEKALRWTRRRPSLAGLVAVSALATCALAGTLVWHNARLEREVIESHAREVRGQRLLHSSRLSQVFTAWEGGDFNTADRLLRSLEPAPGEEDHRSFDGRLLWSLVHPELPVRSLEGFLSNRCAWSSDGSTVALGSPHHRIQLIDGTTFDPIGTLDPQTGPVSCLAFSPDGTLLACGESRGRGLVWRVASRALHLELVGHQKELHSIAFSPDGTKLATTSWDQSLRIWDAQTGREEFQIQEGVARLAFHPTQRLLAFSRNQGIGVFDLEKREVRSSLTAPGHVPFSVAFSPDGRFLASGCHDGTTLLWDTATWEAPVKRKNQEGVIFALAFSPDGRILAASGDDSTVSLLDLRSGKSLPPLRGSIVDGLAFSPSGDLLLTAGRFGKTQLWSADPFRQNPVTLGGHGVGLSLAAFTEDGTTLFTCDRDLVLNVWDAVQLRKGIPVEPRAIFRWSLERYWRSPALSPDGRFLAIGSKEGHIALFDAATGEERCRLPGLADLHGALVFSPGSRFLAGAGTGKVARVWGRDSSKEVSGWIERSNFPLPQGDYERAALSPDGDLLALTRYDEPEVFLLDTGTGRRVATLSYHSRWVAAIQFSPDGRLLATGGIDNKLMVWEIHRGAGGIEVRRRATFRGGHQGVASVAFSLDGKVLVTGWFDGADGSVRFWDIATGEERGVLKGHQAQVDGVTFSPDGTLLAAVGGLLQGPGQIRVWRASPIQGHSSTD